MKMADDYLPLASSYGGKLFQLVRSSFVDSLEASLKSYYVQLTQVHADTRNLSYNHLSQVDNLREHRAVTLFLILGVRTSRTHRLLKTKKTKSQDHY